MVNLSFSRWNCHSPICLAMPTSKKVSSFLSVQETRFVIGKTFKDRIWTLKHRTLTTSTNERFKFTNVTVKEGRAWAGVSLGIEIETVEGKVLRAVTVSKVQWAMWMQAFQDLTPVKDTPPTPVKVRFNDKVLVRTIPASDDEDDNWTTASSDEDDD
ncbi:unnamed protein product [Aphanomyces euteiches]